MVAERLVRRAIVALRRSRLMPRSSVDRLLSLTDAPVVATVVVYFPTAPVTLYQLRAWYPALSTLHAAHPVVVVCRDSRTARAVREEAGLAAVSVGTLAELEDLVSVTAPRLLLYPNLDVLDFEALTFPEPAHVYIGHGDSDKTVFSSRQVAAFDRYLVATEESVRRVGEHLLFADADELCVVIGEPQADLHRWDEPATTTPRRVVYAPTWEGATAHDAHSSLLTHGEATIEALLAAPDVTVVLRPHPLTGSRDPRFAALDTRLRRRVVERGGVVDDGPDLVATFRGASALVCDVSAVSSQWRPSGRPLVVLRPDQPLDGSSLLAELHRAWSDPAPPPVAQAPATQRFVDACSAIIADRDRRAGHLQTDPGGRG